MKAKIFEALKAKFEGVSDQILEVKAGSLAKTITSEEQIAPAVEGVTLQQVIESYGDHRATGATKTAVMNYEQRHRLKDGKPIVGGGDGDEPDPSPKPNTSPSIADEIAKAIKPLADELTEIKRRELDGARLTALQDKLKACADEGYAGVILNSYKRMRFEGDEDFDAYLAQVESDVASRNTAHAEATLRGSGAPIIPKGGSGAVTAEQAEAIATQLLK